LQRHADEADPDAAELADRGAREQRPPLFVEHVRREVGELRPLERAIELARLARRVLLAAALLHAPELGDAAVELVVADGGETEPEAVERHDRRLVEEMGRDQRARADQVAGGDGDRVRLPLAEPRQRGAEPRRSAEPVLPPLARGEPGLRTGRGFDVAVEIVEPEDLHGLDRGRLWKVGDGGAGSEPGKAHRGSEGPQARPGSGVLHRRAPALPQTKMAAPRGAAISLRSAASLRTRS